MPTLRRGAPALLVAVVGAVGALLVWSWRDRLPDPVATHWGTGPDPNGFTSVTGVLLSVVIAAAVGVVCCLPVLLRRIDVNVRRMIGGIACGTAVFVLVLMVALTGTQLDLPDASHAPMRWWALIVALAAGGLCGLAAGYAVPPMHDDAPAPAVIGQVPVATDADAASLRESLPWIGRASFGPPGWIVIGGALAVVVAVAAAADLWIPLTIVAVVLLLVVGGSAVVTLRITSAEVRVAATLGWPRTVIPLDQIDHAELVDVHALRDFGGWGYRIGFSAALKGAVGWVVRSGPAVMIVRTADAPASRRRDVIVVDDAVRAATVINTLAARR